MTNTLNKTIYLKAEKAQVWTYLTDPDKLAIWFHKPAAPLSQGEDYAMHGVQSGDKLMWGKVIRAQPYDLLEYTFTIGPMG
ncbi:MAG: SRPBCC family protein, partial [Octadecabacter sp.]